MGALSTHAYAWCNQWVEPLILWRYQSFSEMHVHMVMWLKWYPCPYNDEHGPLNKVSWNESKYINCDSECNVKWNMWINWELNRMKQSCRIYDKTKAIPQTMKPLNYRIYKLWKSDPLNCEIIEISTLWNNWHIDAISCWRHKIKHAASC